MADSSFRSQLDSVGFLVTNNRIFSAWERTAWIYGAHRMSWKTRGQLWVRHNQRSSENPLLPLPLDTKPVTSTHTGYEIRPGCQSSVLGTLTPPSLRSQSLVHFLSSCKSFSQKTLNLSNFVFQVEAWNGLCLAGGPRSHACATKGIRRQVSHRKFLKCYKRVHK